MTFKQTIPVINNQVIINLPASFKDRKKVIVVIQDEDVDKINKLNLLKSAMKDPLFLADIKEINADFDVLD